MLNRLLNGDPVPINGATEHEPTKGQKHEGYNITIYVHSTIIARDP